MVVDKLLKWIDLLEHADLARRQSICSQLVAEGAGQVELLVANMDLATGKTKAALIDVLVALQARPALLPVMRYIFDSQGDVHAADDRALAMKGLAALARDEDAERIVAFCRTSRKTETTSCECTVPDTWDSTGTAQRYPPWSVWHWTPRRWCRKWPRSP